MGDNEHLADLEVTVLPESRRHGIGRALHADDAMARARAEGRLTVCGEVHVASAVAHADQLFVGDRGRDVHLAADRRPALGAGAGHRVVVQCAADPMSTAFRQHSDLEIGQVLVVAHRAGDLGRSDRSDAVEGEQERAAVVRVRLLHAVAQRVPGPEQGIRPVGEHRGPLGVEVRPEDPLVVRVHLDDPGHGRQRAGPGVRAERALRRCPRGAMLPP